MSWRTTLFSAVHRLSDPRATPDQIKQATSALEALQSDPSTLENVISLFAENQRGSLPADAQLIAGVLLRQSLRKHWVIADDGLRKSKDCAVYMQFTSKAMHACKLLLEMACESPNDQRLTPFLGSLSIVMADCVRHGIAATQLVSGLEKSLQPVMGEATEFLAVMLRTATSGPDINLRARCSLLVASVIEEISSTSHLSSIGLDSRMHLHVRRCLETAFLPEVFIQHFKALKEGMASPNPQLGWLGAQIQVLITVFDWTFRIGGAPLSHEAARPFLTPVELAPCFFQFPTEVSEWQPSDFFDLIFKLDAALTPFPEAAVHARRLLQRVAAMRVTHINSLYRVPTRSSTPLSQKRAQASQKIFTPFLMALLSRAVDAVNAVKSVASSDTQAEIQAVRRTTDYIECFQVLMCNADCALYELLSPPKQDALITGPGLEFNCNVLNLFIDVMQVAAFRVRTVRDEALTLAEGALRVLGYCAYLVAQSVLPEQRDRYEQALAEPVCNFVVNSWPLLDADTADELEDITKGRGESEVQLTTEESSGGSRGLRSLTLNLGDDRFLARLGLFAEVCRLCPIQVINSLLGQLESVMRKSTLGLLDLDFTRFFFLMCTAILTTEPHLTGRNGASGPSVQFFYRDTGSFAACHARLPWNLVNHPVCTEAQTLSHFFRTLFSQDGLSILSPRSLNQLSPVVIEALLVFLIRTTHACCFYSTSSASGHPVALLASEEASLAFLDMVLKFFFECLSALSGEAEVLRIALLGLHSFASLETLTSPHLWDCPHYQSLGLAAIRPGGLLERLPSQSKARLMEFMALSVLPTEWAWEAVENNLQLSPKFEQQWLERQSEIFASTMHLHTFHTSLTDPPVLMTKVAGLRGLVRGFLRLVSFPRHKEWQWCNQALRRLLFVLCGAELHQLEPAQVNSHIVQRCLTTRLTGEYGGKLVEDITWLDCLRHLPETTPPDVNAEVCGLLKAIFSLCSLAGNLSGEGLVLLFGPLRSITLAQANLYASSDTTGDASSVDSRLNWLRSLLSLTKLTVKYSSPKSQMEGPRSAADVTRENVAQQLLTAVVLPLISRLIQTENFLSSMDQDGNALKVFLSYLRSASALFTWQSEAALTELRGQFPTRMVQLLGRALDENIVYRMEAEDLLCTIAYTLIDDEASGQPTGAFNDWQYPLTEFLGHVMQKATAEKHVAGKLRSLANATCALQIALAARPQALATGLDAILQRFSATPSSRQAWEIHLKNQYEFAMTTAKARIENQSATLMSRQVLFHKFYEGFEAFVIDCQAVNF